MCYKWLQPSIQGSSWNSYVPSFIWFLIIVRNSSEIHTNQADVNWAMRSDSLGILKLESTDSACSEQIRIQPEFCRIPWSARMFSWCAGEQPLVDHEGPSPIYWRPRYRWARFPSLPTAKVQAHGSVAHGRACNWDIPEEQGRRLLRHEATGLKCLQTNRESLFLFQVTWTFDFHCVCVSSFQWVLRFIRSLFCCIDYNNDNLGLHQNFNDSGGDLRRQLIIRISNWHQNKLIWPTHMHKYVH